MFGESGRWTVFFVMYWGEDGYKVFFLKLRSSAVSVEHGSQLVYNCIYYIIFNCTESGEEQTFAVFADLNTQYLLIY